ncbi:UPF0187-domain-containing protein [Gonapodya prolifera JEL478]|uniref:UPF0187-domain-containing protein n=1 Tax=Gonapodya prolifera (strain JEL478) TaxID=1344416 RepID=A0A139ACL9_GONPJ|nr:UPF0187-domain-containing protein [Gonapodya prolifera JEL478]|eukprot:KXS14566.1 UPF0187-domain-containing protein [Gonapodya prolifera JEL478]
MAAPILHPVKKHIRRVKRSWFWEALFQHRGSIASQVLPSVFLLTVWSVLIAVLNYYGGAQIYLSETFITLLGVVLSLLLAFRSNQAYERFSEGRKVYGTLTAQMRNVMRLLVTGITINPPTPAGDEAIQKGYKLIVAFMYSMKHYLRAENDQSQWEDMNDVLDVIPPAVVPDAAQNGPVDPTNASNPALVATSTTGSTTELKKGLSTSVDVDSNINFYPDKLPFRIAQALAKHNAVNIAQGTMVLLPYGNSLDGMITGIVDASTTLERIATTPIPKAYNIHLKQILLIYCFSLPIQLMAKLGWWMVLVIAITAYCLLGVEMIARQLEMPFGYDENDLPIDDFCESLRDEFEKLVEDHRDIN